MTAIIDIKYDQIPKNTSKEELLKKLQNTFTDYNWGGGFKLTEIRADDRYFYANYETTIFKSSDRTTIRFEMYAVGMMSGYLLAKGVEIL